MTNPQPIRDYLAAVSELNNGQQERAAQLLAQAVGTDAPPVIMRDNIVSLLTPGTRANDGILQLVANEVARRRGPDD